MFDYLAIVPPYMHISFIRLCWEKEEATGCLEYCVQHLSVNVDFHRILQQKNGFEEELT